MPAALAPLGGGIGGPPSADLVAEVYPGVEVRKQLDKNETLLSIDKARRVLGYEPEHSWRDER